MAFADGTFVRLDSGANSNAGKMFLYKEVATLAAIRAANYFDLAVASYSLADEDVIVILGSDGFGLSQMSVTAGAATIGEGLTSA